MPHVPHNPHVQYLLDQVTPVQLRDILIQYFSLDELKELCFDLGVDYEQLPGESKGAKARELVQYVDRRGQRRQLIDRCYQIRPQATWPAATPTSGPPTRETPVANQLQSQSHGLGLFFSYSHKDERLRDKLAEHLRALERQQVISTWHDRRISAGTEWAGQIDNHLNTANIILLLVSAAFLNSDYCYDIELQRALERHAAGEARVIPVILRPCDWTHTAFAKLQALPADGKPVTTWSNRDEAFLNITQGIRRVAQELTTNA